MVTLNAAGNDPMKGAAGEAERRQILYDWNDTRAPCPDVCVNQLFEQQVDRTPDAVAIVFGERKLTYRELNQRANQVGNFLRKSGVGPETLVGVCLKRSPELVIALLGVWKAGGAYVPLDPSYPGERLSFMVRDAEVRILLTEQACKTLFSFSGELALCLDSDWPRVAAESTANPDAAARPSNMAYCMYTSGSTGAPKGAMILHSGLVNYLVWAIETYAVEAGASVPVHSSIAFDLTVTSLYPALLTGGQVELLAEDFAAQNLVGALRRRKNFGLVKITPAHLDMLTQQLRPEELAGLTKAFVIGGENLPAESLTHWRDYAPTTRLINEYGPTETVVGCCTYEVRPEDPRNGPVPIGRPIANTELYVLDADLRPVSPGVTGELYIGGAGVARGYLNRPELTQERFLPDPFSGRDGARLYRTGDLARHRVDGTIEYLGRIDDQVKIRGYRIELGEIEARVAGHPATHSCAVLAREDTPGNKQLVAYVVPREGLQPSANEMVAFLKEHLPEYMVPAHFVFLGTMPLTTNGKIDRKALPAPADILSPARSYAAPRTKLETDLVEVWQRMLGVERVGIHDNFFDLGGTSLTVLKLMVEMENAAGLRFALSEVFRLPTIASLVESVGSASAQESDVTGGPEAVRDDASAVVALQSEGDRPPIFCLCGISLYQEFAKSLGKRQPVYGVYVPEEQKLTDQAVKGAKLDLAIRRMAEAYHDAIVGVSPRGPYRLAGSSFGGIVALEVASMMRREGSVVDLVALLDTVSPRAVRRTWSNWLYLRSRQILRGEAPRKLWGKVSKFRDALAARGVIPPRPNPDRAEEVYAATQAAYRAASRVWKPHSVVTHLNTVLFRASDQDWGLDDDYGWRHYLGSGLSIVHVPGDHMGILKNPHVADLGRLVDEYLTSGRA